MASWSLRAGCMGQPPGKARGPGGQKILQKKTLMSVNFSIKLPIFQQPTELDNIKFFGGVFWVMRGKTPNSTMFLLARYFLESPEGCIRFRWWMIMVTCNFHGNFKPFEILHFTNSPHAAGRLSTFRSRPDVVDYNSIISVSWPRRKLLPDPNCIKS